MRWIKLLMTFLAGLSSVLHFHLKSLLNWNGKDRLYEMFYNSHFVVQTHKAAGCLNW